MTDIEEQNKSTARKWLYELLAKVEGCRNVVGERREKGRTTTLELKFPDIKEQQ